MGETQDLKALTPPEVDGQLADLSEQKAKAEFAIVSNVQQLHRYVGDPGKRGAFDLSEAECRAKVPDVGDYYRKYAEEAVAAIDAERAELAVLAGEINLRQKEWARRGCWSRFFLVKNNNGHIHSSTDCSTCFDTTRFGWLPQLSGLTEKDAVDDQGEILCTVCFPSAPSAWTSGESKATKEAKAQRAAEKAERAAKKLAKALLPSGEDLVVEIDGRTEHFTSLAQAKQWLTNAAEWNVVYGNYPRVRDDGTVQESHPSYPNDAGLIVADAVADKTGDSIEDVIAAAIKRAQKRK